MDPCDLNYTTTTRSLSTPISLLQSNEEELIQQFDSQPEVDVNGRKRRGRQPVVLTEEEKNEKKRKKNDKDKAYRLQIKERTRNDKEELDRMLKIASRFGGIDEMELQINRMDPQLVEAEMFQQLILNTNEHYRLQQEAELHQFGQPKSMLEKFKQSGAELHKLEQMKSKFGGIGEMESMLEKFKESEAELHKLEQMKSKFGGIGEMESMLEKFKESEAELHKLEQMKSKFGGIGEMESMLEKFKESEAELLKRESMKSIFGGNGERESMLVKFKESEDDDLVRLFPCGIAKRLEMSSATMDKQSSDDEDWTSEISAMLCRMSPAPANKQYSDVLVTELIGKLNEEVRSKVSFSSFKDLDGERERVGQYSFPPSLVSTVKDMIKFYGDITDKSFHGPSSVETTFILLAAAIKEMGDVLLKQVNEEHLFRWRDAIKDAKRSNFTVEFATEHLKTIAYAYYGLKACNDLTTVRERLTNSIAAEKSLREELERKEHEVKALKDMEEELTSPQCKMCQDSANCFLNKTVGLF